MNTWWILVSQKIEITTATKHHIHKIPQNKFKHVVKALYSEDYIKHWWKKLKKIPINRKIFCACALRELLVKMSTQHKATHRLTAIPTKILMAFPTKLEER